MHHILAFEEDVGTTADDAMDIIPDQIAQSDSGAAFFQQEMQLIAAYAGGATILRTRLVSPNLRQVAIPYIIPVNSGVTPTDDPNIMDLRRTPTTLRGLERFQPESTSGVAMGTERHYCVLVVSPSPMYDAPVGQMVTLRATGTTTLVQGTWVDVPLTWDQQLARGQYAIVGGHCQSATCVAWRLILENQVWRPGGIGMTAITRRVPDMFYGGGLGTWGEFFSTGLPRLQVMANAGDTAENLFLQVVRVAA